MTARPLRTAAGAAALAFALSAAIQGISGGIRTAELLAGWGVAALLGVAAIRISLHAVGRTTGSFLLWGVGAQGLRAALLVSFIIASDRNAELHTTPLVASALTTYVVFMAAEIRVLSGMSSKSRQGA